MNAGSIRESLEIDYVARSTAAGEYIAVSNATEMVLWAMMITAKLEGSDPNKAIPLLFCDNKAAVQLSRGISLTSKIKHIDSAYHHVLDETKNGRIKIY